jgi:hypothetical protein
LIHKYLNNRYRKTKPSYFNPFQWVPGVLRQAQDERAKAGLKTGDKIT